MKTFHRRKNCILRFWVGGARYRKTSDVYWRGHQISVVQTISLKRVAIRVSYYTLNPVRRYWNKNAYLLLMHHPIFEGHASTYYQGCRVGGKISDSWLRLSKISDSDSLHKGNEIWLFISVEIVVHSKSSLFQQKFQKKLYHFKRNSQFRSVM